MKKISALNILKNRDISPLYLGMYYKEMLDLWGEPFDIFPVSDCDSTPSKIFYPGVNLYFDWNDTGKLDNVGLESLDIYSYRPEKKFVRFCGFKRSWFRDRNGSRKFFKFLEQHNIEHKHYISDFNDLVTVVNEKTLCHHCGCDSSSNINDILMDSQLKFIYLNDELTNTFTWTRAFL
ncbi:hypothetical protein [Coralliovum pocilloporae]|uniref:hypothetical protein n=1 Tax=Coralliovum pocilloporae TaxID=3066369 RepID=UPI00330722E5